jgi:hypothetical protein
MATAGQLKQVAEFLRENKIGFEICGRKKPGDWSISGTPTTTVPFDLTTTVKVDIYPVAYGSQFGSRSTAEIYELLAKDPTTRITLW